MMRSQTKQVRRSHIVSKWFASSGTRFDANSRLCCIYRMKLVRGMYCIRQSSIRTKFLIDLSLDSVVVAI